MRPLLLTPALIFSLLLVFHEQLCAQKQVKNYVRMRDENGKSIPFKLKQEVRFEIQNGKMNLAVLSAGNYSLQVTGIDEALLKDTVLKSKQYRLILIDSKGKSFKNREQSLSDLLILKCRSLLPGSPMMVVLSGKVFDETKYIKIDAQLSGRIPAKKYTTDLKTN